MGEVPSPGAGRQLPPTQRGPPIPAEDDAPATKRVAKFAPELLADEELASAADGETMAPDAEELYSEPEAVPGAFKCCIVFLIYLWCSLMIAAVGVPIAMFRQGGMDAECGTGCILTSVLVPCGFLLCTCGCCLVCCCCLKVPIDDDGTPLAGGVSRISARFLPRDSAFVRITDRAATHKRAV